MKTRNPSDNLYATGTLVSAKIAPALKLVITKYYQRIYYCMVVGDASHKELAYFERELMSPIVLNQ